VADYTITAANGDRLVVHLEAQTVPDAANPQTMLTFSGTGRLAGAVGNLTTSGWSEVQNPQTGEGIGYLEIGGDISKFVATLTVTNPDDSGPGSLRQAILDANATPELETIAFNIPGAPPYSLRPPTVLPTISVPVFLDGTTQPGFVDKPVVELDGSTGTLETKPDVGLRITEGNSLVRGLVSNRFGSNPFSHAQILILGMA